MPETQLRHLFYAFMCALLLACGGNETPEDATPPGEPQANNLGNLIADGSGFTSGNDPASDGSSSNTEVKPELTEFSAEYVANQVELLWLASSNADLAAYIIRRALIPITDYRVGDMIYRGRNLASIDPTPPMADTVYYRLFLQLSNGDIIAADSTSIRTLTTVDDTPPASVANAQLDIANETLLLRWLDPIDSDLRHINIYRQIDSAPDTASTPDWRIDIGQQTLTDTDVRPNTQYYYSLIAEDALGQISNPVTLNLRFEDIQPPAPVANLQALVSSSSVQLNWFAPADDDLDHFLIIRHSSHFPAVSEANDSNSVTTAATSLTEGGLSQQTYYYGVFAVDAEGNTSTPAYLSVTPATINRPSTATGMTANAGVSEGDIDIVWTVDGASNPVIDGQILIVSEQAFVSAPDGLTNVERFDLGAADSSFTYTAGDSQPRFFSLFTMAGSTASIPAQIQGQANDTTAPPLATSFQASAGSQGIQLNWQLPADNDLTDVIVRWSTDVAPADVNSGTLLSQIDRSNTRLLHSQISAGQTYYYGLFTSDAAGNVAAGPGLSASATALAQSTVENLINLQAIPGDQQVTFEWQLLTDTRLRVYLIRSEVSSAAIDDAANVVQFAEGTLTQFTDTGLNNARQYYYWLYTEDPATQEQSTPVQLTQTPADSLPPLQVQNVSAEASLDSILLRWDESNISDARQIIICMSQNSAPQNSTQGTQVYNAEPGRLTAFAVENLQPETLYYFSFFTLDAQNNESYPVSLYSQTIDTQPPAKPEQFKAQSYDGRVALSWSEPVDTDVSDALLVRSTAFISSPEDGTQFPIPANQLSFSDTTVSNGEQYYYALYFIDQGGLFSLAALTDAAPLDTTAPEPVNTFQVAALDASADLQWNLPVDADRDEIIVRYQLGDLPITTPLGGENSSGPLAADSTGILISDLTNDQTYTFSVFTLDSIGNWLNYASATATPRSLAPTPPAASFQATGGDTVVYLNWVNPPSNYDSIEIRRSTISFNDALNNGSLVTGAALSQGVSNTTDSGRLNGVTYFYTLVNNGPNGQSTEVTASALPIDQTEPLPISALNATPSDQQISFNWQDPPDADLDHILIRRGDLDFPLTENDGIEVAQVAPGVEAVIDTGLTNDDINFYAFFAVDINGYVSQRVTYAAAARDTIAPASVTAASLVPGNAQVTLQWTNPVDSDLARIVIRRSSLGYPLTASSDFSVASLDSGGGSIPQSFTDTGLTNEQLYYYSLFALDGNNNASPAVQLQGTPQDLEPPPPINNVQVTELDGQVDFTWNNPASSDFDRVVLLRRADQPPTAWDDAGALLIYDGSGQSVSDTLTLVNGISYFYRFFALDSYNNAATSDISAGPHDLTPPPAPTCTSCTYGDELVQLNWNDPASADLYRIHIRRSSVSPPASLNDGTPFAAIAPGVGTFTDSPLTNGTTYFYALFSEDNAGNVSPAYTVSPLTPADELAPASPNNGAVTSAEGSVTLDWDNPLDADFSRLVIRRDTSAYPASLTDGILVADFNAYESSFIDTSISNGLDYYYSLFALDEVDNPSAPLQLLGQPRDVTPPPPITGAAGTPLDQQVDLTWTNPLHPDFDHVLILRRTGSYPTDPLDASATVIYTGSNESHSDTDSLTNFIDYYYRLFAIDAFDNYSSTDLIVQPIDLTPPSLASCTSCTGGDEQAVLQWTDPPEADLDYLHIRRKTGGYPTSISDGDFVANVAAGTQTYTDTGLTNNTTYYYAIYSVDNNLSPNTSAAYQVPAITPQDNINPAPVSILTVTSVNQRVSLLWNNPGDDTQTVHVRRSTTAYPASAVTGTMVADVVIGGATDTITDLAVTNNQLYYYSLFSEDEAGNLSVAAQITATPLDQTPPANVTGLSVTGGDYATNLSWTNPGDADFSQVKIYRRAGSAPTATATYLITTLNSGEVSYNDTGLSAYVQYFYLITSGDTLNNFSTGSSASDYTDYATIADVTLWLTMEKDSKVFLQWQPSTHVHYDHVEIRRDTAAVPINPTDGTLVYSGTATQWEDTGLTNGTTYHYTLFSVEDDNDITPGTSISLTPIPSGTLEYEGPVNFDGNGAGQAGAVEHYNIGGTPTRRLLVGAQNNSTASYSSLTAIDYNGAQYSSYHYDWGSSPQTITDFTMYSYWFVTGSRYDGTDTNDDFSVWKIYSGLSGLYDSMLFDTGSANFDDQATNITYYSGYYFSSGYRDISGTLKPVVWRTDYYADLQIGFNSGSWTIPTEDAEGYVVDQIHMQNGRYVFAIESTTGRDSLVMASLSSTTGTLDTSFDSNGELLFNDSEITALARSQSSETSLPFPIYASTVTAGGDAKIYAVNADGTLVAGFGTAGVVTLNDVNGDLRIEDMVYESVSGQLHVIGSILETGDHDIYYWRIANDGTVEVSNRLTDNSLGTAGYQDQWPSRILLDQFSLQVLFTATGYDGGTGYEILFGRIAND